MSLTRASAACVDLVTVAPIDRVSDRVVFELCPAALDAAETRPSICW